MIDPIRIVGLDEFRRDLRRMDSGMPKAIRVALNESAGLVVADAQPKVPRLTGRASSTLRVASTQREARVRGGGARAPYYPWLDFGGAVGRNDSVRRAFLPQGRYAWQSFIELRNRGVLQQRMNAALVAVARESGIEVG